MPPALFYCFFFAQKSYKVVLFICCDTMGERYLVTGVQLGMLTVLSKESDRKKLIDEIIEKQFVGDSDSNIVDDATAMAKVWAQP